MTETPTYAPAFTVERETRRQFTPAPYAGPVRAEPLVATRSTNAVALPYVPAPFRGKPILEVARDGQPAHPAGPAIAANGELPWIDAFLEDARTAQHPENPQEPESEDSREPSLADASAGPDTEIWPLDETGANLRAIGENFSEPAPAAEASNASQGSNELPKWTSGEWMDIMPVAAGSEATPPSDEAAPAADEAAEHAARIMEDLATQLRSGELKVASNVQAMSAPAVVANILSALLGRGH